MPKLITLFPVIGIFFMVAQAKTQSLVEQLGYDAEQRLLIINADDAGLSQSTNQAIKEGVDKGIITSSSLMVTCPWFPDMVRLIKQMKRASFGVHLTLTSEWKRYKWRPLSSKSESLVDRFGYFWRNNQEVYQHAQLDEVYFEAKKQIELALASGVDVTHLDSHMGTFQFHPNFFDVYAKLALEYNLPLRVGSQSLIEKYLNLPKLRHTLREKGLVFPDFLIYEKFNHNKETRKSYWLRQLSNLKPGVTEIYLHPAIEGEELKAITNRFATRHSDYYLFTVDEDIRNKIKNQNIRLISYRPLRDLQRDKK